MQKQTSFYNHRNHSGQFYARSQYLQDQAAGRLAFAVFIGITVISAFFELIANTLIK